MDHVLFFGEVFLRASVVRSDTNGARLCIHSFKAGGDFKKGDLRLVRDLSPHSSSSSSSQPVAEYPLPHIAINDSIQDPVMAFQVIDDLCTGLRAPTVLLKQGGSLEVIQYVSLDRQLIFLGSAIEEHFVDWFILEDGPLLIWSRSIEEGGGGGVFGSNMRGKNSNVTSLLNIQQMPCLKSILPLSTRLLSLQSIVPQEALDSNLSSSNDYGDLFSEPGVLALRTTSTENSDDSDDDFSSQILAIVLYSSYYIAPEGSDDESAGRESPIFPSFRSNVFQVDSLDVILHAVGPLQTVIPWDLIPSCVLLAEGSIQDVIFVGRTNKQILKLVRGVVESYAEPQFQPSALCLVETAHGPLLYARSDSYHVEFYSESSLKALLSSSEYCPVCVADFDPSSYGSLICQKREAPNFEESLFVLDLDSFFHVSPLHEHISSSMGSSQSRENALQSILSSIQSRLQLGNAELCSLRVINSQKELLLKSHLHSLSEQLPMREPDLLKSRVVLISGSKDESSLSPTPSADKTNSISLEITNFNYFVRKFCVEICCDVKNLHSDPFFRLSLVASVLPSSSTPSTGSNQRDGLFFDSSSSNECPIMMPHQTVSLSGSFYISVTNLQSLILESEVDILPAVSYLPCTPSSHSTLETGKIFKMSKFAFKLPLHEILGSSLPDATPHEPLPHLPSVSYRFRPSQPRVFGSKQEQRQVMNLGDWLDTLHSLPVFKSNGAASLKVHTDGSVTIHSDDELAFSVAAQTLFVEASRRGYEITVQETTTKREALDRAVANFQHELQLLTTLSRLPDEGCLPCVLQGMLDTNEAVSELLGISARQSISK